MYSTLAGFVEPGETLEEAVRREVFEESGIKVGAVQYHSSQPWPFPGNIMLGFYGEGLSEDITIDPEEMLDVRWFSREQIAQLRGTRLPAAARGQHRTPADRGLDGRGVRGWCVPAGAARCWPPAAARTTARRRSASGRRIRTRRAVRSTRGDQWRLHAAGSGTLADLLWAKRQADLKCLREKGLAPPGGVEPVRPPVY